LRWLWSADLNFTLKGRERWALVGANGSGKSTLLRQIESAAWEDERAVAKMFSPITRGELSARPRSVAYLNQEPSFLATERPLLEVFRERTPQLSEDERRVRLARFLFPGLKAMRACASLSGGEKMRAALACVLNQDPLPRLLILDEPTNDLDLASVEEIEKALRDLSCALLVVSHDPRFLEAIGVDHRLELSDRA
jgi:ATPase subunit of ABC transporter with duplicated ATPase domains